jgi:hypothetical protein
MDGFVDPELARRFERLEARAAAHLVALRRHDLPDSGAETREIAGATCAWFAPESVLSHVFGLGLAGRTTAADLAAIEEFYAAKGDRRVQVELSPHARKDALLALGARGYALTGFEQLLARPLAGFAPAPLPDGITVRAIDPGDPADAALWIGVAGAGFFAPDGVPRALEGVFELTFRMPETTGLLAFAEGEPAAAAAVSVNDGIGALFGAATLARFRRRGVHAALLDARLALAARVGALWATAGAMVASGSQHNMERRGFRVAYTRPVMVRAL